MPAVRVAVLQTPTAVARLALRQALRQALAQAAA
jgi:hypothetical protein